MRTLLSSDQELTADRRGQTIIVDKGYISSDPDPGCTKGASARHPPTATGCPALARN